MERNGIMNLKAMYKLSYGLFVLTAKEKERDNGCIINTVTQVTSEPNRIIIAVNKNNYTHDMIMNTRKFNISVLTEKSKFETYKHWGFQSGATTDKCENIIFHRSKNGVIYLTEECNAFLSAEVISTTDLGTHTLFLADVVAAEVLSEDTSVTYDYYQKHIKMNPTIEQQKKGYICTVCGYIYEGEPLPEDFICPWCKHPASDFIPLNSVDH